MQVVTNHTALSCIASTNKMWFLKHLRHCCKFLDSLAFGHSLPALEATSEPAFVRREVSIDTSFRLKHYCGL